MAMQSKGREVVLERDGKYQIKKLSKVGKEDWQKMNEDMANFVLGDWRKLYEEIANVENGVIKYRRQQRTRKKTRKASQKGK